MSDDLLCFSAGPDTVARAYQLAAQRGVDLDGLLPVLIREVDSREFETQLHAEIAHLRGRISAVLALEEPAEGPDEEDFHNGQRWMLKKVRSRLLGATDTTADTEVCSKCGTAGCLEDARSGWYDDEEAMSEHHPGESDATGLERELADLTAEDGSVWSYSARSGGYTSPGHPDVVCRDTAAVAYHVSGTDGTVRQARPGDSPREATDE